MPIYGHMNIFHNAVIFGSIPKFLLRDAKEIIIYQITF